MSAKQSYFWSILLILLSPLGAFATSPLACPDCSKKAVSSESSIVEMLDRVDGIKRTIDQARVEKEVKVKAKIIKAAEKKDLGELERIWREDTTNPSLEDFKGHTYSGQILDLLWGPSVEIVNRFETGKFHKNKDRGEFTMVFYSENDSKGNSGHNLHLDKEGEVPRMPYKIYEATSKSDSDRKFVIADYGTGSVGKLSIRRTYRDVFRKVSGTNLILGKFYLSPGGVTEEHPQLNDANGRIDGQGVQTMFFLMEDTGSNQLSSPEYEKLREEALRTQKKDQ